jgi:hypothetical protein
MDNKRVLVLIALALAACALFVPLLRADEPATQPADASAITAWDGSTDKGSGWTTPKSDKISLTADGEGYKGKKSVQFKASASGFIAFGWNWIGWYPPGAGTDASAADRVRFYVKLTGDAKPHDFNIHLSSANGKPSKDVQLSKNATEKGANERSRQRGFRPQGGPRTRHEPMVRRQRQLHAADRLYPVPTGRRQIGVASRRLATYDGRSNYSLGECWVPGGPRGLQNRRRRRASGAR